MPAWSRPPRCSFSDRLSAATGANVYLKREDLQAVRSYKLRGAYNLLMQLSDDEIAAGVVCSSAGNHAQGFAYACRSLGIHGRVYVPAKTPKQKRDRIRYHGGEFIELIVGGSTYDLAAEAALADVERTGATLVPPYDDPRTMAGQGTIAVEILDQLDGEPDLVVVPVGGGGCIAGITTYLAERTTKTSVLGIEPAGAAAMMAALANGGPVTLDHVDQFVDGAAVSRAGTLTYAALAAAGDMVSITTVDEGAVCTAMLDLYQNEGIIAEPAGALAVAGLLEADIEPGSTVVCLVSGGNNDVSRYGEMLERSLVHLGPQALLPGRLPAGARCAAPIPGQRARPQRRHHAVRVRQAQQPRDRRGAGRHRVGLGRRPGRPAGTDAGYRDADRGHRAGFAGLPLSAVGAAQRVSTTRCAISARRTFICWDNLRNISKAAMASIVKRSIRIPLAWPMTSLLSRAAFNCWLSRLARMAAAA